MYDRETFRAINSQSRKRSIIAQWIFLVCLLIGFLVVWIFREEVSQSQAPEIGVSNQTTEFGKDPKLKIVLLYSLICALGWYLLTTTVPGPKCPSCQRSLISQESLGLLSKYCGHCGERVIRETETSSVPESDQIDLRKFRLQFAKCENYKIRTLLKIAPSVLPPLIGLVSVWEPVNKGLITLGWVEDKDTASKLMTFCLLGWMLFSLFGSFWFFGKERPKEPTCPSCGGSFPELFPVSRKMVIASRTCPTCYKQFLKESNPVLQESHHSLLIPRERFLEAMQKHRRILITFAVFSLALLFVWMMIWIIFWKPILFWIRDLGLEDQSFDEFFLTLLIGIPALYVGFFGYLSYRKLRRNPHSSCPTCESNLFTKRESVLHSNRCFRCDTQILENSTSSAETSQSILMNFKEYQEKQNHQKIPIWFFVGYAILGLMMLVVIILSGPVGLESADEVRDEELSVRNTIFYFVRLLLLLPWLGILFFLYVLYFRPQQLVCPCHSCGTDLLKFEMKSIVITTKNCWNCGVQVLQRDSDANLDSVEAK